MMAENGLKWCPGCHEKKPLVAYWFSKNKSDGHYDICKRCVKERTRKRELELYGRVVRERGPKMTVEQKREKKSRYNSKNRGRTAAYWRERRRRDPKLDRRKHLKRKYGIQYRDYLSMLDRQAGVCAICGRPETRIFRGRLCDLSVDHCHETEKRSGKVWVRGLLCHKCNWGLGQFSDSPSVLRRAAAYLERFPAWPTK